MTWVIQVACMCFVSGYMYTHVKIGIYKVNIQIRLIDETFITFGLKGCFSAALTMEKEKNEQFNRLYITD